MKYFSISVIAASAAGILALAQPASAVIYDWQFTNEDGNFGSNTDVVSGFVEFSATSSGDLANQTNVPAIDLQITSVTGLPTGSDPFFDGRAIELNQNIVLAANQALLENLFSFNTDSDIISADFDSDSFDGPDFHWEGLNLKNDEAFFGVVSNSPSPFGYEDSDSSSLVFQLQTTSTSVPFEFSPTLGIIAVSSFFAGSRLLKRRNTFGKIE